MLLGRSNGKTASKMIVVGGCYRELCDHPQFDAVLGSGGRAAIVLAELCRKVKLATYQPSSLHDRLYQIVSVIKCFETDGGVNYRSDRLI
jgi:hypothetical protein